MQIPEITLLPHLWHKCDLEYQVGYITLRGNMKPFIVEGVDTDDGSRTMLGCFTNSGEAVQFLRRYTRTENAGGWSLIEVYDTRGKDAERIAVWEREAE